MDLLQNLLGGGQQRQQVQDFVGRYEQGAPWDGISDQEALQNYQRIAPQLPPQLYQESAQEAFARLTPQQRVQLGQFLAQQSRQQGQSFPDFNGDGLDDRYQDPRYLAQAAGHMQQQQPGLLDQLLGGALGGGMGRSNARQAGGSSVGSMLSHPIAKAALAGIAATAAKRMLSGR
jgi:hypothetical protein